jgi:hypothetical protein
LTDWFGGVIGTLRFAEHVLKFSGVHETAGHGTADQINYLVESKVIFEIHESVA